MRFDPQTITVTDHKVRTSQIDAMVALHDNSPTNTPSRTPPAGCACISVRCPPRTSRAAG